MVEVGPGLYRSPYVALGRIQEKYTCWVFLSSNAWHILASLIPGVSTIVKLGLDKEMHLHLNGRVLLAVSKFHENQNQNL